LNATLALRRNKTSGETFTAMHAMELALRVANRRPVQSVTDVDRLSRWFRWVLCRCRWSSLAENAKVKVKFSNTFALSAVETNLFPKQNFLKSMSLKEALMEVRSQLRDKEIKYTAKNKVILSSYLRSANISTTDASRITCMLQ
jgi:hypothetical protein